ncbi:TetR/AcrR family transcriptional regulator C-terminal domain-containing protein [Amycolatopsis sp. FU40]|uniref:TetR/AcrR family transcriptional regulator C-terminal domain-containing protein n=1 Tax=Amycolatopsis sp. FU40 TaxID=2914159 RepID=UPI001EFF9FFF|nr:TetR/AcrR family transcriptional regulator C-terminal domain-containing protein [Amycolatopsis sp. FU40]UKD59561.1 TetR/AcrR family transcriptional regulator C-terminal domain-containing protein [Amycolatopsis sp. FU40]
MPTEPPYLRIAAALREEISQLPPGAKVPSTRQLASAHGVANATAAKALDVLRREGVIRAEPRSGHVVAGQHAEAESKRPVLSRDRLVRAAIAIADTEGVAALSMRGLAARLGVPAMAPYRYLSGKDELIFLMADTVYGETGYPAREPEGWRAQLELVARTLWSVHRRHPWLAHLVPLTRPWPLPNLAAHNERALAALSVFGLNSADLCDLNVLFYNHIQGTAIHLERERHAMGTTGITEDQWMEKQARGYAALTGSGRYPVLARMVRDLAEEGYDLDLDHLFEIGLQALLDGLAVRYPVGGAVSGRQDQGS